MTDAIGRSGVVIQCGMRVSFECALAGRQVGTVEEITVFPGSEVRKGGVFVRVLLDRPLAGGCVCHGPGPMVRSTMLDDDVTPILV